MAKLPRHQNTQPPVTNPVSAPVSAQSLHRRWLLPALAVLMLVVLAGLWAYQFHGGGHVATAASAAQPARFVDEQRCISCHTGESELWKSSHHAQAMAVATPQTVLGNFNDATLDYNGIHSRFYRKGAEYWVDTDGPDGKMGSFKVSHTFGVAPLQQYLMEMPGGRLQALGMAWDTGKKSWFHLYPNDKMTHADELHWTKPAQNANFMCAECHTTDLKRNFNIANNSYKTTWHALGVGCQACHGPASRHMEWAALGDKKPAIPGSGFDVAFKDNRQQTILETCARCHARRAPLGDGFTNNKRLADDYAVSLLTPTLYEVDGHFKDEDFEYGSFVQSKMFMKGVTCLDCHNAHNATRPEGNGMCLQCHNATAAIQRADLDTKALQHKDYDSPEHTHHAKGSVGAACVDCHMPGKFYMVNDFRHDHSMSIPRPDLSRSLGTPNACNLCHKDKTPEWSVSKVTSWYGRHTYPTGFGEMLHSLRTGGHGAADVLGTLVLDPTVPPIRRATALAEAARYPSEATVKVVIAALKDNDPLVRAAAVDALGMLPPDARMPLLTPLLTDPVRQVRIATARQLVPMRDQLGADTPRWQKAIAEYRQVQTDLTERPESHLNLAGLELEMGQIAAAQHEVELALSVNPDFLAAVALKADLLARAGDGQAGLALLQTTLQRFPDSALLYHALGLAQIRAGDRSTALQSLRMAWQKAPANADYGYIYAIALHDTGDPKAAIAQLDKVIKAHPEHRDSAMTAVRYRIEANDTAGAQAIAANWLKISPGEPSLGNPANRTNAGQGGKQ